MTAVVTRVGPLSMQVCVPERWSDAEIKTFAERERPCGTENGWFIRRQGDALLAGCDERVACESRSGHVHVMLDA